MSLSSKKLKFVKYNKDSKTNQTFEVSLYTTKAECPGYRHLCVRSGTDTLYAPCDADGQQYVRSSKLALQYDEPDNADPDALPQPRILKVASIAFAVSGYTRSVELATGGVGLPFGRFSWTETRVIKVDGYANTSDGFNFYADRLPDANGIGWTAKMYLDGIQLTPFNRSRMLSGGDHTISLVVEATFGWTSGESCSFSYIGS